MFGPRASEAVRHIIKQTDVSSASDRGAYLNSISSAQARTIRHRLQHELKSLWWRMAIGERFRAGHGAMCECVI